MTRLDAFITAATFGGWVLIAAALLTTGWVIARATYWTVRLLRAAAQWTRDTQRIEDIETRAAIPAAPDNKPGINRSDWDDCQLILAATNDVQAGLDQLFKQLGPPRKEE